MYLSDRPRAEVKTRVGAEAEAEAGVKDLEAVEVGVGIPLFFS